jgi:putative FmdB family regulatory protein
MPSYQFYCTNPDCLDKKHDSSTQYFMFEIEQRMTDDHVANCPKCGQTAERIYTIGGIGFKGSGFHVNDYPR